MLINFLTGKIFLLQLSLAGRRDSPGGYPEMIAQLDGIFSSNSSFRLAFLELLMQLSSKFLFHDLLLGLSSCVYILMRLYCDCCSYYCIYLMVYREVVAMFDRVGPV